MNSIKSDSHDDKEERAISILDSLKSAVDVIEEDDGKYSSNDSDDKLDVGCLREPDSVQKVPLQQKT